MYVQQCGLMEIYLTLGVIIQHYFIFLLNCPQLWLLAAILSSWWDCARVSVVCGLPSFLAYKALQAHCVYFLPWS